MANNKPKKAPGKFRKPGESAAIAAQKEKMARESGRLDTVRILPPSAYLPNPSIAGSAKYQRLMRKKGGR